MSYVEDFLAPWPTSPGRGLKPLDQGFLTWGAEISFRGCWGKATYVAVNGKRNTFGQIGLYLIVVATSL